MSFFPIAPKRPYSITQHGETRIDNYYWMRDRQDPEVLKYLRAESDYLEEVMGHTKPLQEMLYAEMKGRMKETDSTVPEKRGEYFYYTRTEEGRQYPIYCRRKEFLKILRRFCSIRIFLQMENPFAASARSSSAPMETSSPIPSMWKAQRCTHCISRI